MKMKLFIFIGIVSAAAVLLILNTEKNSVEQFITKKVSEAKAVSSKHKTKIVKGEELELSSVAELVELRPGKAKLTRKKPLNLDVIKTTQSAVAIKSTASLNKRLNSEKKSKFSSTLRLSAETDFKETNQTDKTYGSGIDLFLNYKFNDEYKASLWLKGEKDISGGYDEKVGDSTLRITKRAYELSNKLTFTPSVAGVYPTSKASKVRDEMIFAVDLSGTLSYKVSNNLNVAYITRPKKYFHKFETSRSNKTNKSLQYLHFFSVSYSLTDKLSFDPLVIYVHTWSYSGRKKNDTYLSILEVNYAATKKYGLALGVMTGGSIVNKEKGKNETVEFYDENSSSLYGQLDIRF